MSSRTILAESALQARLRDKLNSENVKLWLEPFFDANNKTVNDGEIIALASRYATEIETSEEEVVDCLLFLQRNALERLAERDLFKETGMSTVRIKLSGFPVSQSGSANVDRVHVNLSQMTGKDLKKEIAASISCVENQLKLISHGRVINENQVLELQNVKNGTQIMALFVPVDSQTFQNSEDNFRLLEETKDSANYLAGQSEAGGEMYSLQVTDQSGKKLDLPEAERKNLAVALALHEKGRAALKSLEYSKALVFLLEADNVYNQCQSALLERVDNYGLLNLDVAWCYLSLKSIAELPAVEARLNNCEKALHRSYGENLERVVALKGSTGWESALFVRLHLLQGIAAYHLGHIERSKFLITKVEQEVKQLQVSDDQLAELINMGYGSEESRIALRANYGNVPRAVDWIIRRREEDAQNHKLEKEDRRRRKIQKKLGSCSNGDPVNVQLWTNLKEMGFNAMLSSAALKRTNNDINGALQLVNDTDFMIQVVSSLNRPALSASSGSSSSTQNTSDPEASSSATSVPPAVPMPNLNDLNSVRSALAQSELNLLTEVLSDELLSAEVVARSQKAYDALTKDTCSEADYIDLTLSAEYDYISQYKEFLRM